MKSFWKKKKFRLTRGKFDGANEDLNDGKRKSDNVKVDPTVFVSSSNSRTNLRSSSFYWRIWRKAVKAMLEEKAVNKSWRKDQDLHFGYLRFSETLKLWSWHRFQNEATNLNFDWFSHEAFEEKVSAFKVPIKILIQQPILQQKKNTLMIEIPSAFRW